MDAGTLRHKVTIQQNGGGLDDWGQPLEGWTDLYTRISANVAFLNGKEFVRADKDSQSTSASVRIRKRNGITPAMRLIHKDVTYNITAVLPDANNVYIDLAVSVVQ